MNPGSPRVLLVRRDNIGDLVCTTPLLRALRRQLPPARLCVLANRYNAAVLAGNRDVDRVYAYQKAKHRAPDENLLRLYWDQVTTIAHLRRQRFDWALVPGGPQPTAMRLAQWVAPARIVESSLSDQGHEVERCCALLRRMGLEYETPALKLHADQIELERLRTQVRREAGFSPDRIVGIHISARRPAQRWATDRFLELVGRIPLPGSAALILLWSPGSGRDPKHPGDDEKAACIVRGARGRSLIALATHRLEELIAALALCDEIICADGGAMHLAAALGKPIVCLFGDSDPVRWRPWGVPHELLLGASRNVADITVDEVLSAYGRVRTGASAGRWQE